MKNWAEFKRNGGVSQIYPNRTYARAWERTFERYLAGKYNTWDYPLLFASWWHRQLTVLPEVNLVTNIGFGGVNTHTSNDTQTKLSGIPAFELLDLLHNPIKKPNLVADYKTFRFYMFPSLMRKLARIIKSKLGL